MKTVEIYTTAFCPFCIRAKMLLKQKNAEFTEYAVDREPQLRQEMTERANGGYTVPQIFIDNQHVGGCDELFSLERQGALDTLLTDE